MTFRHVLHALGFVAFVVAAIITWHGGYAESQSDALGLVAAGLACWIAAALP